MSARMGADNRDDVVLVEVDDAIATVTLNRPDSRNAINRAMAQRLPVVLQELEARDEVGAMILTGADPAFCAGLDLKELGTAGTTLAGGGDRQAGDHGDREAGDRPTMTRGPFPAMTKPVIGAINGPAITGGFELALNCDFLVASDRARFGDTHARVGVMPGWGLTVLLPQAIGVRRAREMSFTGNFLSADEAFQWGLVNHVVPHDELLPTARRLALDIAGNDRQGVRQIRQTYAEVTATTVAEGWMVEQRDAKAWQRARFDPEQIAARRAAIMERGRGQA
jgi:enoyl-CoA hydratase